MEQERKEVLRMAERVPEHILLPVVCGIGKVNAARAATEAILQQRPDAVVNFGYAGALSAALKLKDIVLATELAYHDVWCGEGNEPGQVQGSPRFFPSDPVLLKEARKLVPEAVEGLVVTGDQFFISVREDERIRGLYPEAIASDMEGAAIAQVCRHYDLPFLCIRIISDLHGSAEEQAATYSSTMSES